MRSISDGYISKGQPGFRRAATALFAGAVVTYALLYSVQPILPTLSREFAVSPTVASLSLSLATGALALCMPLIAGVSEALGRKRVMAISLGLSVVLCFVTAVSPDFRLLLVCRLLQGVALAGLPAIAMAYVAEEFDPESLGALMGFYISSATIGGLSGRIVTATVTDLDSWRTALLILGVIGLAAGLWFQLALPSERHFRRQPPAFGVLLRVFVRHLRDPGLLCLYLIAFLLMGCFFTLYDYLPYVLIDAPYHLSQATIGWLFTLNLAGTFSSVWMGSLADRFGRRAVLPLGILIMLAGVLLTTVPWLAIKLAGIGICAFGFTGAHSVASGWVVARCGSHRAQASALYLLFFYLGTAVIGTTGGVVWTGAGWMGMIGFLCVLIMMGLGLAMVLRRVGAPRPRLAE